MSGRDSGILEAVDRIVNRGGDADDVLRAVVAALHERGYAWAAIEFVEDGDLVVGPEAGEAGEARESFPVRFNGDRVAELAVAAERLDDGERATLERVALLISPYCLVGWDTGGEEWTP